MFGFEEKKEEKKPESKGRKPDVKGSLSCAGWFETDKNGKKFLNVRMGEGLYVRLYPNEEVEKK